MRQTTLETAGLDRSAKIIRRDGFLAEMEAVAPWAEFSSLIERFYPKAGNGRRPAGLEQTLRLYSLQHWLNLPNPGGEESLYGTHAKHHFAALISAANCCATRPSSATLAIS